MSLWAIIPVKPLRRGKSRLAGVLSEDERTELNKNLLLHTIIALQKVKQIEHVLVVSRDPEALAIARSAKAKTLLEDGTPELNVALARAALIAKAYQVSRILVVPADLPFLDPADVVSIIQAGSKPRSVVIAPDRHHEGTNVLYLNPPDVIEFDYGSHSFFRHCERARAANANLVICDLPSLALDVDYPEDLAMVAGQLRMDFELPVSQSDDHDYDELIL